MIEEKWHSSLIPRSSAVPALACLSRLVRNLCVVEQEKGRVFITPLRDTLAKCREYQSLYITNSGGSSVSQERGDWLLDKVSQLMAEAEKLEQDGRLIEANAVSALAEWRARSLESAVKANPLSIPQNNTKAVIMTQDKPKEEVES